MSDTMPAGIVDRILARLRRQAALPPLSALDPVTWPETVMVEHAVDVTGWGARARCTECRDYCGDVHGMSHGGMVDARYDGYKHLADTHGVEVS